MMETEDDDNGSEDEESMSLKDVIMTLNDFYADKLENMHRLLLVKTGES